MQDVTILRSIYCHHPEQGPSVHIPYHPDHHRQPLYPLGLTLKLYLCVYDLLICTYGAVLQTPCKVLAPCP